MKALSVGMVFALIFTIIVIGLLLTFGMDSIIRFFCFANDAQTTSVIKKLEIAVDSLYEKSEGSSLLFKLKLPSNAKLCFVNASNPSSRFHTDPVKTWNPDITIQDMIKENGYNLWFFHCSGQSGYKITCKNSPQCFQPSDNFCATSGSELYLVNKGEWIEVT
jgi:hypothetical protein